MNFLEKLNYLMAQKCLNKSTLSKACDIPYTTIDGWYKKGYEGLKLTTLRKLASFFGTSLDFWANDDAKIVEFPTNEELFVGKKDEIELLSDYRILNAGAKAHVLGIMKGMAVSERIRNAKGETLKTPTPDVSEFIKKIESFDPEYRAAILELIEHRISDSLDEN